MGSGFLGFFFIGLFGGLVGAVALVISTQHTRRDSSRIRCQIQVYGRSMHALLAFDVN